MALRGDKAVGIPTVLLHEGEGMVVTVETKSGHLYRGTMESVEDTMNTGLKNVIVTDPDGNRTEMKRVFVRGGQVLYIIFPDMLLKAPMFERLRKAAQGISTAGGLGRGRQLAITAKEAKKHADEARAAGMGRGGHGGPGPGAPMPAFSGFGPGGGGRGGIPPMPQGFVMGAVPGPRPPFGGGGGGQFGGGSMGPPPPSGIGVAAPVPGSGRGMDLTRPAWMTR